MAVVGSLEAAPPARHRHPAAAGEVVPAVAGERRHRRVHVAVDVGGFAGRLVEVHLGQAAGDGGHVRLDHGLGDRGGKRRVAGVPALFQDVDGGAGRERVRGDRHPAGALGRSLLAEVGEFDEALAFRGVGRGGRRSGGRKRGAGDAGGGGSEECSAGSADCHGGPPEGRTYQTTGAALVRHCGRNARAGLAPGDDGVGERRAPVDIRSLRRELRSISGAGDGSSGRYPGSAAAAPVDIRGR